MTPRTCHKCGDSLIVNEKLNLMECVSGKHVEPVNLVRAQWWNQCPKCGQMGTNDQDAERLLQVFELVDVKVGNKTVKRRQPVIKRMGDKKGMIVMELNQAQQPTKCRACGHSFTKRSALN